jgi:hypothetical protein
VESPIRDWFDEVAEGECELRDEGASSEDVLVNGFDSNASGGAIVMAGMDELGSVAHDTAKPEDSSFTGQVRPVCDVNDEFFEEDQLLGTPVASLEGEYEGDGITYESSGRLPDLDISEAPWMDSATMIWHIHAIVLRTPDEALSLVNPKKRGNDPGVQVHKGCCTETDRQLNGACEMNSSVLRFEGEDEESNETMDLRVKESPAPNEFPVVEIFDPIDPALKTICPAVLIESIRMSKRVVEPPPNVENPLVGCMKSFEYPETRYNASTTRIVSILAFCRFEPFWAAGTCERGQKVVENMYRVGGLTMMGVGHLERPPGDCGW